MFWWPDNFNNRSIQTHVNMETHFISCIDIACPQTTVVSSITCQLNKRVHLYHASTKMKFYSGLYIYEKGGGEKQTGEEFKLI
jgi:hypothetical protein